jgi:hypothetical protein
MSRETKFKIKFAVDREALANFNAVFGSFGKPAKSLALPEAIAELRDARLRKMQERLAVEQLAHELEGCELRKFLEGSLPPVLAEAERAFGPDDSTCTGPSLAPYWNP